MSAKGLVVLPVVICLAAGVSQVRAEGPQQIICPPVLIAAASPQNVKPAATPSFLPMRRLIEFLGEFEENTSQKVFLRHLADRQLKYLADNPANPLEPARRTNRVRDPIGEENQNDVNHALVWLLQQLDDKTQHEVYGPRLLRLRERTTGFARREAQLALDVLGIEARLEWEQANRRAEGLKPVQSPVGVHQEAPSSVAFSRDGRFLASGGSKDVRVWNTRDWSMVATVACSGPIDKLCFSPDSRVVYLTSRYAGVLACDWRTGKIESTFATQGKDDRQLELSADGRVLAASDPTAKSFLIWDTGTRKLLRTIASPNEVHRMTLGSDGRNLIFEEVLKAAPAGEEDRADSVPGWRLAQIDGPAVPTLDLSGKTGWFFSPDGRYVVSRQPIGPLAPDQPSQTSLRVYDTQRGWREAAFHTESGLGNHLVFSADGRRLLVAEREREAKLHMEDNQFRRLFFAVLSMPTLEILGRWDCVVTDQRRALDHALSPDGQTLAIAIGAEANAPLLFDALTGRRILPSSTQAGRIRQVFFLPGGNTIRTLDSNNLVCLWDAATLRLCGRIDLGVSLEVESARPMDGKYLFCRKYRPGSDEPIPCIVDADTGGEVCTFNDLHHERGKVVWINDSQLVLSLRGYLLRLDYKRGLVLKSSKGNLDQTKAMTDWVPDWQLAKPGLTYLALDGNRFLSETILDLDTGASKRQGQTLLLSHVSWGGEVPGGRFYYLNNPDFQLIDRQSLKVVAEHRLYLAPWQPSFSADGSRFGMVEMGRWSTIRPLEKKICIRETRTGRLLAVLPGAGRKIGLSPDGKRAVLVQDNDTLEMWDLSGLARD